MKTGIARVATISLAAWLWCAAPGGVAAYAQSMSEYQVKAAFLFNFAKFVDWPAEGAEDSFVIGVIGEDPFRGALQAVIKDKSIQGHPVVIRRFANPEEGRNCQILFVSASERKRLPSIFSALRGSAVLTVGDTEGFAKVGGIINFIIDNDRVRLEVNIDAADRARLKISSKLLSLARIVKDAGSRG